jgi:hypothetical protein
MTTEILAEDEILIIFSLNSVINFSCIIPYTGKAEEQMFYRTVSAYATTRG